MKVKMHYRTLLNGLAQFCFAAVTLVAPPLVITSPFWYPPSSKYFLNIKQRK